MDDVATAGAHAGRAILGDQIVGANSAELWVVIDPSADVGATLASIEATLDGYPGLESNVLTYQRERVDAILDTPEGVADKDLTVRVFGPDQATLQAQAERLTETIAGIDGVQNPTIDTPVMEPSLEVEVDLDKAQAIGIKPGDVRRAAATLLSGVVVGNLFEEQKVFDVVVWGTPAIRNDVSAIRRLSIETPSGTNVELGDVADVRIVPTASVIEHADVSAYLDVGIDVEGRGLGAVADDIQAEMRQMGFPLDYHAEVLRDFEQQDSSRTAFLLSLLVCAIGIYLILQSGLRSWRMASAISLALVVATSGGVIAAAISGDRVTIGTLIGLLAVFGLAVRNAVVFVRRVQHLEDDGAEFGADLVSARRDRAAAGHRAHCGTRTDHLSPLPDPRFTRRSRDRQPDGDRHHRRPRQHDARVTVRGADAAPGLRPTPGRRPRPHRRRTRIRTHVHPDDRRNGARVGNHHDHNRDRSTEIADHT